MTITLTDLQDELVLSPLRCSDGNGTLSYLFFSEEYVDVQRAKAICAKCSSRQDCLSAALDRAEPWGVWGGELLEDGRICETKRPRGRPVTRAVAVARVEEVPIPLHLRPTARQKPGKVLSVA
ncbi:MAG: WhiB family transcriptional regulator [Actinobacteria bacterium]|nr:WhiB family transcriptional regulator [Actinomycetota bacterium]